MNDVNNKITEGIGNDTYLTIPEAAQFLKLSVSSIQKISASRKLPIYKPTNGKVYFLKDDLAKFIASARLASRSEIVDSIT